MLRKLRLGIVAVVAIFWGLAPSLAGPNDYVFARAKGRARLGAFERLQLVSAGECIAGQLPGPEAEVCQRIWERQKALALSSAALVAMPMLVEIPSLMTGMVMVLARNFLLTGLVAVTMLIQVPRLVVRMIMVLAGHFLLAGLVAVAALVEVARGVAGMIVMRAGLFLCHGPSPLLPEQEQRSARRYVPMLGGRCPAALSCWTGFACKRTELGLFGITAMPPVSAMRSRK